jgi:FemAB family.
MSDVERIFSNKNWDEYVEVLTRHNVLSDIYFDSGFLDADANLQNGEYEIYFLENEQKYFIYPYIKVPFTFGNRTLFDLISPYGYAGPISNDRFFFNYAEKKFIEYTRKDENIVTEFVRYHYLYGERQKFSVEINNEKNRDIVTLNLQNPWDSLFKNDFSPTARNLVRKMENQGFNFEIDDKFQNIDDFIALYYGNMKHASAADFYYFPKDFFYKLKDNLPGKMILAHIKKDNEIYCSSLFFLHSGIVTYYLSGRDIQFSQIPSNYLILSSMVKWSEENGFKLFNFGGGRSTQVDDNLLKFKQHFSKNTTPYFTGKRVHNIALINEIREDFISRKGIEEFQRKRHLLQFYR